MKKIITFSLLLCIYMVVFCGTVFGQPVLVSTMTPYPVGTMDSIYGAAATVAPGSGGAGVTWNLSGLTPVPEGLITVVTPSSSPYFSTFPTATFCARLSPSGGGAAYIYERLSPTKWEQLANNYSGPGTGTDYTPNPESAVEFPMSYLNSFVDTFQKVGGGPNTVTITYDGYGTLITPFATYTNVVRIYKYWGPGDYDYNWYVTSPYLDIVASFDMQSNAYTLVKTNSTTSIKENTSAESVSLFPNPLKDKATLTIDAPGGLNNASLILTDISGKVLKEIGISNTCTELQKDALEAGLYFYQVFNNGTRIANGKLIIR